MLCFIDLSNFGDGVIIGAVFAAALILYGGFCGLRNQIRRHFDKMDGRE